MTGAAGDHRAGLHRRRRSPGPTGRPATEATTAVTRATPPAAEPRRPVQPDRLRAGIASFAKAPAGPSWTVLAKGAGHVVGPIRSGSRRRAQGDSTRYYRAQFDLLAAIGKAPETYRSPPDNPDPPSDAANPYQFVGAQLAARLRLDRFLRQHAAGRHLAWPPPTCRSTGSIRCSASTTGRACPTASRVPGSATAPQLTVKMTFSPKLDKTRDGQQGRRGLQRDDLSAVRQDLSPAQGRDRHGRGLRRQARPAAHGACRPRPLDVRRADILATERPHHPAGDRQDAAHSTDLRAADVPIRSATTYRRLCCC